MLLPEGTSIAVYDPILTISAWIVPLHRPICGHRQRGGLFCLCARAHFQIDVRIRDAELLEKLPGMARS